MKFEELREANVVRGLESFPVCMAHWTIADWTVALAGEAGEACDAVKKLRRCCDGTSQEKDPQTAEECVEGIANELADMITYADLLAYHLGIDLGKAVARKFNAVSRRVQSAVFLSEE